MNPKDFGNNGMSMLGTMLDEFAFLFSGRGMPYDKVAIAVMLACTVLLSAIFHFNYAEKANVAIIDLDNSSYTHELISKINSSQYMQVYTVLNTPVDPNTMFYEDKCVAVVYFPKDFEKDVYASKAADVGVFYDNTNTAQSAGIKQALNEIVGTETAMMSNSDNRMGLSLNERALYNPHDSSANGEVLGFLFFFGSMFFTFATIGMIPRLKLTGQLAIHFEKGNPFELMMRIVPYAMIWIGACFMGMVILKYTNGMTVNGNIFMFFVTQILFVMTMGMMSLWFGWNAANPGVAASRMILFIPGGFILGGQTGPIPMIDPIVQYISHIFPLVWEFELVRDIIIRGAGFWDCATEIGQFLVFCCIVWLLFIQRFYASRKQYEVQKLSDNEDDD